MVRLSAGKHPAIPHTAENKNILVMSAFAQADEHNHSGDKKRPAFAGLIKHMVNAVIAVHFAAVGWLGRAWLEMLVPGWIVSFAR